ncbi:MAG TPA: hypothetical protein VHH36_07015 [Candidatus Thermoplasmatota archaeon]|nr:hypothetical protein [Candidatus Thermoplasmatota archaeon]
MRMAGPDVALFIVGLLIFAGAGYALYEQDAFSSAGQQASALGLFNVAYATESVALDPVPVPSMRAGTAAVKVNQTDVSKVTVVVACQDQAAGGAAAAFTVTIDVVGPDNLTGSGSGACGGTGVAVAIDVAPVPGATSAQGATEPEARAKLAQAPNATRAVGDWTVTISGGRAGTGGVLPQDPTAPAGTVTFTLDVWTPKFSPVQK